MRTILTIMLYVLIILGVVAIYGLIVSDNHPSVNSKNERTLSSGAKVEIITIDSCEYVYGPWGNGAVLTHKGNCKNSIHKK
jgi:hypothetical protein